MNNKVKTIQFIGHSATFFHGDNFLLAVDPWLEGNPICPEPLKNPERMDVIVLTHGHFDHAGDVVRLVKKYRSKVVAMYELGALLEEEGVPGDLLIQMSKGGTVDVDGVLVTLTQAMHSSSFDSKNGTKYAGEPCGVVLRSGGTSIYHAGDTALFSDMALIKDEYQPQIALLPIGDRFTMGPKEAAKAAKLVGVKTAIPVHHSTFPLLTGTPTAFSKHCSELGISVCTLEPGQSVEVSKIS